MCGITGLYFPNGAQEQDLRKMALAIAHRGPDAEGVHLHGPFGLAHRRLSILDLSTAAHQPMTSACGRYVTVYNGEVYNFRELKHQLGLRTQTTSDTEVILEAFAKLGPQMVERLNGMFAIAILDKIEDRLYLFRDRMGIKPLYVYQHEGMLAFASELKAITALGAKLPMTVNHTAIPYFLHLGYIPEPLSIYNEVEKFPSGHWAVFDGHGLKTECYWSPDQYITKELWTDEASAKLKLDELLTASVKRRLISDVPFGTFLSGGIDSSLVTALAQKVSDSPVKTFSIGFNNVKHNESHYAAQVAQRLGTEHHSYTVTEKDALELATDILPQYDEPFADSSAIPTMLVSKLARQEVTMTLSGDGGDELFHGYGAYKWAERLSAPNAELLRSPAYHLLSFGNDRHRRVAKLLRPNAGGTSASHIFSQEQYLFSAREIADLLTGGSEAFRLLNDHDRLEDGLSRKLTPAERQAFFDMRFYLKDDLLVKVDRATMRYGLETRVPLLDHTVVEFALNLDPSLKMRNGTAKYLLKQVLYDYVPKELFDRPKWGFSIPLSEWLRGDLSFLIEEHLNEQNVKGAGLVRWPVARGIVADFRCGQHHLYNRIWLLILLHLWWQRRTR
ncbi:MAG: asparagine synthase (glutamine-hydrolyzing) [Flavobacteriales bacterium]|nr:asparagine synthase (glutamine-hydrolyzing) [Flavobacteriales bacterium]